MRYFRATDIFGRKFTSRTAKPLLSKPVPEVLEFRPANWPKKNFSGQSARRSSRGTLSPSYTKWFFSSIAVVAWLEKILVESFRKKDSTKPRKSQAVTWAQGNNIRRSIFTADLSKVYRKFISLMYAISTLLLVACEACRVHNSFLKTVLRKYA